MTIIPYVNNLKDLKTNYSNGFVNTNQTSEFLNSFICQLNMYCDDYKEGHIEEEIINENVNNLFKKYSINLTTNDLTYMYNYFKNINEDISNVIKNYIFL